MKSKEKRALWLENVNNYRSSNLTAQAWCEQNNIKVHSLRSLFVF